MTKLLAVGLKDLKLIFRDPAALVMLLAAPFVLTLGLGFVSGRFSGGPTTTLRDIPVVIVDQDGGELAGQLVAVLTSDELADLLAPTQVSDAEAAREQVRAEVAAAAVIIPAGFSKSIIPAAPGDDPGPAVAVEVLTNPARPTSSAVVTAIVEQFMGQVEAGRVAFAVTLEQLLESGLVRPEDLGGLAPALAGRVADPEQLEPMIVARRTAGEPAQTFDVLAYFAPGMAMLFLMYAVSLGGRSLLAERDAGTLARLLTTPTATTQVLGGKVLGIFLTGVVQVGVLVVGSTLLFGLKWGDPLAVALLVAAVALAATGWGLVLAALARSPGQVVSVGTALMLTFGVLSGTFVQTTGLPAWFRAVGKLTPNAWGLDGFLRLAQGGGLASILGPVAALAVMAAALFGAAVVLFGRNRRLAVRG